VIASHVSEESTIRNPKRLVQELALRKATAVAKRLKNSTDARVLGADTIVVLGREILGKPRDAGHAYEMLYRLAGSTHQVMTGVAVVDVRSGHAVTDYAVSQVRMKKIPVDTIMKLSRRHLDKAGSYAIQEKTDPIARVINGSYDNVVGLPVALVRRLLRDLKREMVHVKS
jgi:septum formation protein